MEKIKLTQILRWNQKTIDELRDFEAKHKNNFPKIRKPHPALVDPYKIVPISQL